MFDGLSHEWVVDDVHFDVDSTGLAVLTLGLVAPEGAAGERSVERLVVFGSLAGNCYTTDDDGILRRVLRPASGSLCGEVVSWL